MSIISPVVSLPTAYFVWKDRQSDALVEMNMALPAAQAVDAPRLHVVVRN
jgi:hypothetical protein